MSLQAPPSPRMRPALWLAGGALLLSLTGCAAWRIGESARLVRASEPLQVSPAAPAASLLIVGDSTAVGTGASSSAQSLAGLLARDHPRLRIVNRAQDGARFADVARQLASLAPGERFDGVLVQAGGNDVIRLTGAEALRADIERVATLARQHSDRVILMPAGNVGHAPFFFAPLSWWMTERSRTLHELVHAAAERHGAVYVNLFHDRDSDPFVRQPELNARDGLHPSDAGYRVWLQALLAQSDLGERLAAARTR